MGPEAHVRSSVLTDDSIEKALRSDGKLYTCRSTSTVISAFA